MCIPFIWLHFKNCSHILSLWCLLMNRCVENPSMCSLMWLWLRVCAHTSFLPYQTIAHTTSKLWRSTVTRLWPLSPRRSPLLIPGVCFTRVVLIPITPAPTSLREKEEARICTAPPSLLIWCTLEWTCCWQHRPAVSVRSVWDKKEHFISSCRAGNM